MSKVSLLRGSIGHAASQGRFDLIETRAGEAGAIVYGPYEEREPGRYRVEFEIGAVNEVLVGDPVVAIIDVHANRGATLIAEQRILHSKLQGDTSPFTIEFDLQERRALEYRVMATGKSGLLSSNFVKVERLGNARKIAEPKSLDQLIWQNEREFLDGYLRNVTGLIHVGANMGQERRYYWLLGLDVIWIEPIQEVYDILVDHVSRYPRQKAVRALLTSRPGESVVLRIANNAGASSSILPLEDHSVIFPGTDYIEDRVIVSTTLSEMIQAEGISLKQYQALTLDVEGAEKMVLEGAMSILNQFKYIKCEVADFPVRTGTPSIADLDGILQTAGFREFARRGFADGPSNQGTMWDIVWKRMDDTDEFVHEPGYSLPLVFNPQEVEAVEKCE